MRAVFIVLLSVCLLGCQTAGTKMGAGASTKGVLPMVSVNGEGDWEAGLALNMYQLYEQPGKGSLVLAGTVGGTEDTLDDGDGGSSTYAPSLGLALGWQTPPFIADQPWAVLQPMAGVTWGFDEEEAEGFVGLGIGRVIF